MRFFKRKQRKSIESVIEQDGYDAAVRYASELVLKTIPDRAVAYRFVVQQIEAASRGDHESAIFAATSGITSTDYEGSSLINLPGVAGPAGPLAQMLELCLEAKGANATGEKLRWDIVDSVMQEYEIGKYCRPSSDPRLVHLVESIEKLDSGAFVAINNDLGFFTEANPKLPDITRMAYMYARRIAVAGMYLQGHVDKDLVVYVKNLFLALGHSTDGSEAFQTEANTQARELVNAYLPMLTPLVMKKMIDLAENPDTELDCSGHTLSDVEVILELEKPNPFLHEDDIAEEETLSDFVQQVANTDWGAFRNLLEDISKAGPMLISDPLLSAGAGYAMELAVAGLFVSGLVNYQMINDKRDGILLFKADIGDDKDMHLLAARQALCLAQLYIPNINEDHVASIIQTANLKSSLRENGEPPLNPTEVLSRLEILLLENPAAEPVEISKGPRFDTFQQAAEWARQVSGRVITPSTDGSCYIGKEALSHGKEIEHEKRGIGRVDEIAKAYVKHANYSLDYASMEISQESAKNLVRDTHSHISDEIFRNYNSELVAIALMLNTAKSGAHFHSYDAACLLSCSVIWGVRSLTDQGSLNQVEASYAADLKSGAAALINEHHGKVEVVAAQNWISATMLAQLPSPL